MALIFVIPQYKSPLSSFCITSMSGLSRTIEEEHPSLSSEQLQQVKQVDQYLADNRVHEILNEAVARLIETRPEKVKEGLAAILRAMKDKQTFFKKSDFESMFESYDFFSSKGGNQIPFTSLVQALDRINVHYTREDFLAAYPQFKLDRAVKKLDFINIMETEYRKKIRL